MPTADHPDAAARRAFWSRLKPRDPAELPPPVELPSPMEASHALVSPDTLQDLKAWEQEFPESDEGKSRLWRMLIWSILWLVLAFLLGNLGAGLYLLCFPFH